MNTGDYRSVLAHGLPTTGGAADGAAVLSQGLLVSAPATPPGDFVRITLVLPALRRSVLTLPVCRRVEF